MNEETTDSLIVWGGGTTRTMRVVWTLVELGLEFEHYPIGARTGETQTESYLALNPKGKIPVLCHGALTLSESAAIVGYLTESFPTPAGFLVPADPPARARLNEWCYFIMTELDAHSLYIIRRHEALGHIYGAAPEVCASAREYFLKQTHAVAGSIEAAGPYLMGDEFSIADILMLTITDWAQRYAIALPQELAAYHRRVTARPGYRRAMSINYPKASPDQPGPTR